MHEGGRSKPGSHVCSENVPGINIMLFSSWGRYKSGLWRGTWAGIWGSVAGGFWMD